MSALILILVLLLAIAILANTLVRRHPQELLGYCEHCGKPILAGGKAIAYPSEIYYCCWQCELEDEK